MTRALVPLAAGVEEMEAVIIIDVLRRSGWEVVAAGVTPSPILASRGVRLLADAEWSQLDPAAFDILIIPGGAGGTDVLAQTPSVLAAVRDFRAAGKPLAAICAGPLVLQAAGVLHGVRATCHPGVASRLTATPRLPERVVVDGNTITSQGPGTTMEFALAIIEHVDGARTAKAVAPGLMMPPSMY